ncbi:MAG TPA: hypothetical protein VD905_12280 [Flavobacteriales bacterium]|nr:hypothetical protein [Flavobacteriales bacterium]
MKKLILSMALVGYVALINTNQASAQAVGQGNIITVPQYGFPNLFAYALRTAYNNSNYTGLEIKGFGPTGVQFEFMVTDKIGLGLKSNFSSTSISYDENTEVYDPNTGQYTSSIYNYKLKFVRWRAMPRFSFHFGNSDKFDGYFGVAAGYSAFKLSYETDDPNYTGDIAISNPVPIGFRLDVGGNYFFTEKMGLNFEIGLGGGPVINAGIATKF